MIRSTEGIRHIAIGATTAMLWLSPGSAADRTVSGKVEKRRRQLQGELQANTPRSHLWQEVHYD